MSKRTNQQSRPVQKSVPSQAPTLGRYFLGNIFAFLRRHGGLLILASLIGYCVHEVSQAFIAYAGRESTANLSLSILANLNIAISIAITVTGLSIALYLNESRQHRKTRERLADRNRALELKIDPARTSSRLTSEGTTRKEDA